MAEGGVDGFAEDREQFVEFGLGDDEGWGKHDDVVPRAGEKASFSHCLGEGWDAAGHGPGVELDGTHEAEATHLTDGRVGRVGTQSGLQACSHGGGTRDQTLVLDDVEVGMRDGAASRMCGIRECMPPPACRWLVIDDCTDCVADDDPAEWLVPGGDALGE